MTPVTNNLIVWNFSVIVEGYRFCTSMNLAFVVFLAKYRLPVFVDTDFNDGTYPVMATGLGCIYPLELIL
jgi:hypothetical protein